MEQPLIVNHGEYEFTRFERAVSELQEEYGYEGLAWDMVVTSGDFDVLCDFLNGDGLDAELD
ncbi:hypothetical protein NSQ95_05580 [Psychrobacillus sp. FSL W7-1457]|uniref:hypothetical protein n=1 Tax=unclassified Psychrobacillus TaxID=2636677 RepID=UPI0030F67DCF